jgi:MFS family permease
VTAPAVERSLWRHRDFLRLWSAETISQFGTQVTFLAMPLAAITVLHATSFEVGLLTTFEFLPFLVVGLQAGVWVDRRSRRPILIASDLGRAVALGTVPLLYALDALTMPQLYVVVFVTGVMTVFFDVAYMSYLPSLVERDELIDGNAKLEISRSAAQLGGPGLAGLLVEAIKAPYAIALDAASYVGSAVFLLRIRAPEPAVDAPESGRHPRVRSEVAQGLRYVFGHVHLRWIAACTATSNFFSSMTLAVVVVYAVRVLDLSAGAIGLIFAVGNVGALIAAVVVRRLTTNVRLGLLIVASIGFGGAAGILIPLAPHNAPAPFLIGSYIAFSFGGVVYNVSQGSYRQAITPHRMQGKMNATMRFIVWGTMPLGSFIGGVLGSTIGLHPTLWVAALGGATAVLPVALSSVRSIERIPVLNDD